MTVEVGELTQAFESLIRFTDGQPHGPCIDADAAMAVIRSSVGATASTWDRGRWAGAHDALTVVRSLNGNGHDEPSDPALDAAEEAIRRMIEQRHGPVAARAGVVCSTDHKRDLSQQIDLDTGAPTGRYACFECGWVAP